MVSPLYDKQAGDIVNHAGIAEPHLERARVGLDRLEFGHEGWIDEVPNVTDVSGGLIPPVHPFTPKDRRTIQDRQMGSRKRGATKGVAGSNRKRAAVRRQAATGAAATTAGVMAVSVRCRLGVGGQLRKGVRGCEQLHDLRHRPQGMSARALCVGGNALYNSNCWRKRRAGFFHPVASGDTLLCV